MLEQVRYAGCHVDSRDTNYVLVPASGRNRRSASGRNDLRVRLGPLVQQTSEAQRQNSRTLHRMVFLLLRCLRGSSIRRHLVGLEQAQAFDVEQLAAWRQDRLFCLLSHARDTTDFYSSLIPTNLSLSSVEAVLNSLPVISRQLIRAESKRFVSNAFPKRKLSLQHTSGSTGIPLSFWRDRDSLLRQKAEVAYFGSWAGYQIGARYLYIGPNRPRVRGWIRNELSLWSTHPDDSWFETLARKLQTRHVEILIAHPSVLIPFTGYLSRSPSRSTNALDLQGVISIAEPLMHEARLRIERLLGCPVLCRYSASEVGIIASECREKRYHLNVGSSYVEYLKLDEDRPNSNGGPSRAIVTALSNYGMPFIRYDTGDIVTPAATLCSCGRLSPLLLRIEGRVLDAITTPDGRPVEAFDLCSQFADLPEVAQFQFTQLRNGSYRIRIVPSSGYADSMKEDLARRLKGILGGSAAIAVEQVENIPPLLSGKTPPIHRER